MLLNEDQVKEYGRKLGREAEPGDVVALTGELGTGKTTLAKAIAEGLCVKEQVTSPSFTLACEYTSGRVPFYHLDAYRLESVKEFTNIGCDEYFYGPGVTVVEWADRVEELLPARALRIDLSYTNEKDGREISAVSGTPTEGREIPPAFRRPAIDSARASRLPAARELRLPMLAIETTGPICSVALMAEDGRVFYRAAEESLTHLTSLLPMTEGLLDEAGIKPKNLRSVAVSSGPGSFTGIRIGVATARALAQTLRVPAISVPTLPTFIYIDGLDTYTEGSDTSMDNAGRPFTVACPIFDARRSQMYAGAFMQEEDGRVMTLVKSGAYDPDEYFRALGAAAAALQKLAARTRGPETSVFLRLMGDGLPEFFETAEAFMKEASASGLKVSAAPVTQDARAAMAWAAAHGSYVEYSGLEPIYIRKAEAQRRLEEKTGAESSFFATRPADEEDVYGMSVIERLSFSEPWLERSILDDLNLEYSDYVVCESDGHIISYAGLHRILDEGHITNIAVHPAWRRRGAGSAALGVLIKRAEALGVTEFTLEVRGSDKSAVRFYEKQGFATEGVRKDYYPAHGGGREDARLMWRRGAKD